MLQGLKVLLVEDEPLVRAYVEGQLKSLGCSVTSTESASEALYELSLDDSWDVVFSDIRLGEGPSGTELARRVLAAFGSNPRVLLTTGFAGEPLDLGPNVSLLRKPYRRAQLVEALTRASRPARRSDAD